MYCPNCNEWRPRRDWTPNQWKTYRTCTETTQFCKVCQRSVRISENRWGCSYQWSSLAPLVEEVRHLFGYSLFWVSWKRFWSSNGDWILFSSGQVKVLTDLQQFWYGKSLIKIWSYYGAVRGSCESLDIGSFLYGLVLDAIAPDMEQLYGQSLGIEKKGYVIESFLGYMHLAIRHGRYDQNAESTKRAISAYLKLEQLCHLVFSLSATCDSNMQVRKFFNEAMQSTSAVPLWV